MNFKRTQTWPGKTHSIIQRSAWGPKSLCIYINQCIVNFNWPMSCARAFLRNNWLPHFCLLLSSPSLSIQNMMTRAMIHPHFKIDEKWILTFLYIYRWNIDLKEKKRWCHHYHQQVLKIGTCHGVTVERKSKRWGEVPAPFRVQRFQVTSIKYHYSFLLLGFFSLTRPEPDPEPGL